MPFTDIPPSYDTSVSREVWKIVAPTIPSSDLCSACLVSRKWHTIFVPFLWGDPASHFGIANDAVYVALTRFKRTLRKARLSVRSLTHTLHLPPALSEIYGGPNPTWLRDVLEYLPNLQSLIVTKLPFFDHLSLLALRTTGVGRNNSPEEEEQPELPTFGLKLLLASSEPNITSIGLTVALPRFPNLIYLDLSYTITARDAAVLASLSALQELQALRLRGCAIRDGEAEVLANSIGLRVRLLDLRDNLLTDMAVRSLLQACFLPFDQSPDADRLNTRHVEDWPIGMAPGPDFLSLDTLRSEELDRELLKQLTNPLTGRLAFEDIPQGGLTHLYIANNHLSVEGLASLLKSERLHILDAGSASTIKTITRNADLNSPTGFIDEVKFPGAEKLIPILARYARKNLTYLRVDHAIVTDKLDVQEEKTPTKPGIELAGSAPLAAELASDQSTLLAEAPAPVHYPVEMPSTNDPIFELDAAPAEPRYELVGDVIHFAVSPPVGDKPTEEQSVEDVLSPIRADGAFAPEPVVNGSDSLDNERPGEGRDPTTLVNSPIISEKVSDESSTHSTNKSLNSIMSPMEPYPDPRNGSMPRSQPVTAIQASDVALPASSSRPSTSASHKSNLTTSKSHPASSLLGPSGPKGLSHRQPRIDHLMNKRPRSLMSDTTRTIPSQTRTSRNQLAFNISVLHPAALPNLRTLVLTNVPPEVPQSSSIISLLKSFISACADEDALSHLLAKTDYSLPPGRARYLAELKHARSLFALRTIIFEMDQPAHLQKPKRAWEHSRQRISMSKSSTGDRDSENLWSAAADDFSFFGEEGEEKDECGIYQHDPDKYFPTAHMDEKYFIDPASNQSTPPGTAGSPRDNYSYSPTLFNNPLGRSATLTSPRQLPLGRNRRSSSEAQRNGTIIDPPRSVMAPKSKVELPGLPPTRFSKASPVSPILPTAKSPDEPMIDLISELASWRKERKQAYQEALIKYRHTRRAGSTGSNATGSEIHDIDMPLVEGHWKGEIKVVRNATPKGRTGVVDMYGNYFEKGYLYP